MTQDSTESRLDRLEIVVAQLATTVSDLSGTVSDLSVVTRQHGEQIDNLRISVNDLREGQAMLTQMFVEERESMQEFRQTTRAALDRIDRTLDYLQNRDRGEGRN